MECNGTTYVGTLEDDLGDIRFVFCDSCRTIAVDAWDARRKRRSWGVTYVDPKKLRPEPRSPASGRDGVRRRRAPRRPCGGTS